MSKRRRSTKKTTTPAQPIRFGQLVKKRQRSSVWSRLVLFAGVATVLLGSGTVLALSMPQAPVSSVYNVTFPKDVLRDYAAMVKQVRLLENRQQALKVKVVSDSELNDMLSQINLDASSSDFAAAREDVKQLKSALHNWNYELSGGSDYGQIIDAAAGSRILPILVYHYTPPDFEAQLEYLEQHRYTVIDLDQALLGLQGGPLPDKPVVLTFDDGFANQMNAFAILQRHHMKATFYIINGGARSLWCIGASRRYNDPLQPASGCGDGYLNWDQIRELDRSGLITIGGHTLDHLNLAGLPAAEQRTEIFDSKAGIEQELGHPIKHFAYPYGAYDQTTIELVHEAGYLTAVTTLPGDYQAPGYEYTLHRVRDTRDLP